MNDVIAPDARRADGQPASMPGGRRAAAAGATRPQLAWIWTVLFLLVASVILFADGGHPISLWDESRTMVNALEMARSGFSVVTTYGFEPDEWNTKPPLMIWLMVASVHAFGASEWALRLPSAIAALATLATVILFTRRVSGSLLTGLLAGALLLLSPAFLVDHGPRSADYDALLTFFTTAYLQLLFLLIHQRRPGAAPVALAGVLVALAVMTKSTAGLVPGIGVVLYLLLARRLGRALAFWWAAFIPVGTVALFLLLREAAAPGYLAAAWHNDVLGRFAGGLIERGYPAQFYVDGLLSGWFFGGAALIGLTLLLFPLLRGRRRAAALFSWCIVVAMLAATGASSTKLQHYILPLYPWLATAVAVTLSGALSRLARRLPRTADGRPRTLPVATIAVGGMLLASPTIAATLQWRWTVVPEMGREPAQNYGRLFDRLKAAGVARVTVYDDGFALETWPHYAPILRAYGLIAEARGMTILARTGPSRALPGETLASCDPRIAPTLARLGREVAAVSGCVAVRN